MEQKPITHKSKTSSTRIKRKKKRTSTRKKKPYWKTIDYSELFSVDLTSNMKYQTIRYILVGIIALAIDFCAMIIANEYFYFSAVESATIGFIIGYTLVYFACIKWVLDMKRSSKTNIYIILMFIGAIGAVLTYSVMQIFFSVIAFPYPFLKALTAIIVSIFNIFAMKTLMFSK